MSSSSRFEKILLIDDEEAVRDSYRIIIEDGPYKGVPVAEKLGTLKEALTFSSFGDAAISDYLLKPSNYAGFNGEDLVLGWYKKRFPAILCTRYQSENILDFRTKRRWIPVILEPGQLNADSLAHSIELIRAEFRGQYSPQRRPWRALVTFTNISDDGRNVGAVIPGWSGDEIELVLEKLPSLLAERLRSAFVRGECFRCFAKANLGVEDERDLYLDDWELT
ncbi:hypothetical protein [Schaalia canis]|uniref:Response regulator n=1 Tax=Schaalia canis TaxID=100469 RepID=A0A3P1SFH2_9ACTO|nr:hypothetical protein [Schaalia canis]RRC95908.1 hypothetical protein EII11_03385 [Schaalia canis]